MRIKAVVLLCVFALAAGILLGSDYDKKTIVQLNEPILVAGVPVVTLEPGSYLIKLMNHDHNRNIVQIFNERGDKLYTTVLAIPNYRLFPKENTTFTYWETPTGNPPALKSWFAPGDNWGQEFVYPKGLAPIIARRVHEPVLSTPAETAAELETAPVTRATEAGEEVPLEVAEAYVPPPQPVAAAPEPAPVEVAAAPEPEPLPATASPYFGFGLIGLMALGAGLTLRRLGYRRSS